MSCSLFHGSWVLVGCGLFAISFCTILTYARTHREVVKLDTLPWCFGIVCDLI
jgi:hypothetical protein